MRNVKLLLIAVILAGCSSPESFEGNADIAEASQELIFNVDVQWANGTSNESKLSQQVLWNCLEEYCGVLWDEKKCQTLEDSVLGTQCRNLANHNQDKCMADFLTQMSESVDREVFWAAAKMPSGFWLSNEAADKQRTAVGGAITTCIGKTVTAANLKDIAVVRFDYPETLAHREELRDMAFKSYFKAVQGAVTVLNPPSGSPPPVTQEELTPPTYNQIYDDGTVNNAKFYRVKLYTSTNVDQLFADNAKLLTWKMTSSLPSLIRQMADLKYSNSIERKTQRTESNDQWASTEHGALPVMWHLYGNVDDSGQNSSPTTPENLTQMMLLAELLPRDPRPETIAVNGKKPFLSPPPMTKSLEAAISLLADNEIDIHAAMTKAGGATTAHRELVSRVDTKRAALGLPAYMEIAKLLVDKGLSQNDLDQALVYMYVHLTVFPRNLSWTPSNPVSITERLTGWYSPYISTPFGYYLNQMYSKHLQKISGQWMNTLNYTGLTEEGLVPALEYLENDLVEVAKIVAAGVNKGGAEVEQDKKMLSSLKDTLKELDRLLGNKRILFAFGNSETGVDNVLLTLVNPTTSSATPTKALDQLVIYAIDQTNVKEIEKFKGLLCFADATCQATMPYKYFPELGACQPEDPTGAIAGKFCQTTSTVSLPNKVNGAAVNLLWVVAHRTSPQSQWQTVGFIDPAKVMKWAPPLRSGSIRLDSEIDAYAQSLISRDSENVSAAACDPISAGEECFDPDFVPAIDNEVVDPNGGQYEDSYRRYLALATEAANKARELREQLVGEYIDKAQESKIAQAQLRAASDDYLRGIETICGNQTRADFEALVDLAQSTVAANATSVTPTTNFGEVLEGFMAKSVANGCLPPGATPATRKDPIHCFEPRDCAGTTLGQLGIQVPGAKTVNRSIGGSGKTKLDFISSCEKWRGDKVFDPSEVLAASCSSHNQSNPAKCTDEKLDRMICWIKRYRDNVGWLIENQRVPQVPATYLLEPNTSQPEGFSSKVDEYVKRKYGQGSYYAGMLEISSSIENLKAAADNYATLFDGTIESIEMIRAAIKSNISAADAQIATQMAAAAMTALNYKDGLQREALNCVDGTMDDLDEAFSLPALIEAIRNIDFKAAAKNSFSELNTAEKFIFVCEEAIEKTPGLTTSFRDKRQIVCRALSDHVRDNGDGGNSKGLWDTNYFGKTESNMSWYCYFDVNKNKFCSLAHDAFVSEMRENHCWENGGDKNMHEDIVKGKACSPRLSIQCSMHNSSIDFSCFALSYDKQNKNDYISWFSTGSWNDDSCMFTSRRDPRHDWLCDVSKGMWFKLPRDYDVVNKMAADVRKEIYTHELQKCENKESGCTFGKLEIDGYKEVIPPTAANLECKGPSSLMMDDQVQRWKDGDLFENFKTSEYFQNQMQMADFGSKMVDLLAKLAESRHGVSNLIRTLSANIAQLNGLEAAQTNLFTEYLNNCDLAESASITTLAEWNFRHDHRREQYKDQLHRARVAAWMARRAIEFRFGVDLSQEKTATNQGKSPSQWADDIYRAVGTRCGDERVGGEADDPLGSAGGQVIQKCYSAENMVEEYVQKLEDYALSYGNSRYDQWWFHEDDDVAVISLRDHVTFGERSCAFGVENFLHFSEELDMTKERFGQVYGNQLAKVEAKGLGFWQGGSAVVANVSSLGLPVEVSREHSSSQARFVFADHGAGPTADLYAPASPSHKLSQDVAMDWELQDGEAQGPAALLKDQALQFSAHVRRAPLNNPKDCGHGERYFPDLGRCGRPCILEAIEVGDELVERHDCPEGMECIEAGHGMGDDGVSTNLHMCVFCSADRSCMGQDGVTLSLGVTDGFNTTERLASRRTVAPSSWTRVVADTVSHAEIPSIGLGNGVSVSISPARSQNLLGSSEELDATWGKATGTTVVLNAAPAPDGVMSGDRVSSSSLAKVWSWSPAGVALVPDVPFGAEFRFTVSMWLRTDVAGGVDVRITPEGFLGATASGSAPRLVHVDEQWKRYEVIGSTTREQNRRIGFRVESILAGAGFDIWGAQVELGVGAGKYVPTGKNLLYDTRFITWASVLGVKRNVPDIAPDGTRGVLEVEDNSVTQAGYVSLEYFPPAGQLATSYTYSVWARTPLAQTQAMVVSIPEYNGSTRLADGGFAPVVVDNQWRRFTFTKHITHADTTIIPIIAYLTGDAGVAQTGTLQFWGPQFEKGVLATGYQSVEEDLEVFPGDGDQPPHPWAIGIAGLDLRPLEIQRCTPDGSLAEGNSTDNIECVTERTGYTRNTYLREHCDKDCELGSRVEGKAYPLLEELYTYRSRQDRIVQFFARFTPGGSEEDPTQVIVFPLSPDSARAGAGSQEGVLAQGNFNYRIRSVFLNIVGTDVIDCANSEAPETCAANQWLSYDLKQMGEVRIRNHSLQDSLRSFKIPTGLIKGGKAWVAEQVIGSPLSGVHQGMVNQMSKMSLMGRPLHGVFELRIHETPEVVWRNVEDVQLVIGYHYWTRSE
jgi:hypothetical protein